MTTTDTQMSKWFNVPRLGQTWEYGAHPQPEHASHMPMFLEPPAVELDGEDLDGAYDCD